jgi:hypothetical protein
VAGLLASRISLLQSEEGPEKAPVPETRPVADGRVIRIRHYRADHTVFIDNDYVIKGVAGAILWKLAQEHSRSGRVEFTNRELRLDPALRLPEYVDNLEARLVLLQRRLRERERGIAIDKCGRGRFRLALDGRLALEEI